MTSTDLFFTLYKNVSFSDDVNEKWFPNHGTFETLIATILAQNTSWQNVLKSLEVLRKENVLDLDRILNLNIDQISFYIKSSGFYNMKSKRIFDISKAIKDKFGNFETFQKDVTRKWLLLQKGIGPESCDTILCYACYKNEMPVDSYALRILGALDYEFESYDEVKEWLENLDFDEILKITNLKDINSIFCMYHGLIDEFCKKYSKKKMIIDDGLDILKTIKHS